MTVQWQTSLFAAMLAAAGIPLYIHLPRFASAELGLSLGMVGAILIGIRVLDFVQDPLLGRMVDRWPVMRGRFAFCAAVGLALGFVVLFSLRSGAPAMQMTLALVILFTAYSLATILIYGQGVALAEQGSGHLGIAGYREAGLIAGVVFAAAAPTLLGFGGGDAYARFGWLLAGLALVVWALTRGLWTARRATVERLDWSALTQAGGLFLLLLALANALPVAITSTLFLFFVEDRLGLPDQAGLFLILFFAAAGCSAPFWSRAATRFGARPVLLLAMVLAIAAFIGAAALPMGAGGAFAAICLASGAALGADMVILPALFASALSTAELPAGQAFGLWAFVAKMALALAAITVLPLLQMQGYSPGGPNAQSALGALNFAYAILPCLLKLAVVAMVFRLPRKVLQP